MNKENFDTKQTQLSNGIKLITIKKDSQISAVHVGVNIGSLYEEKNEKGIKDVTFFLSKSDEGDKFEVALIPYNQFVE